jgi:hypothetical protein
MSATCVLTWLPSRRQTCEAQHLALLASCVVRAMSNIIHTALWFVDMTGFHVCSCNGCWTSFSCYDQPSQVALYVGHSDITSIAWRSLPATGCLSCTVTRRLLVSGLPEGPGIPAGSQLTISYTNNQVSSMKLIIIPYSLLLLVLTACDCLPFYIVTCRLLVSAFPEGAGIPAGSELTISYTNNQVSSMKLLSSWGFTPQLQLMPHDVGGRPDLVLTAQCWALPGLHWQLLAWAACELYVEGILRFSDEQGEEEEVRVIRFGNVCEFAQGCRVCGASVGQLVSCTCQGSCCAFPTNNRQKKR